MRGESGTRPQSGAPLTGAGPTRGRITSWEIALGQHVEALFAVFPGGGGFDQAAVTVLAYELALEYDAPRLRTSSAERPDLWAAAIARAVEALFPETDVAAVTEFLAGGLASEFDPPRPITPEPPHQTSLRRAHASPPGIDRLRFDVHQLMPKDPLTAESLRRPWRYGCRFATHPHEGGKPIPVDSLPSAGNGRHE